MISDKDKYYLRIAREVGSNAKCLRGQVGAVVVKDDQIISTGYNGAPRKRLDCLKIGKCFREDNNIPHGSDYLKCRSVHAETNACLHAGRERAMGATLYMYGYTHICEWCVRIIINTGIIRCVIQASTKSTPKELRVNDLIFEPEDVIDWRIKATDQMSFDLEGLAKS